MIVDISKVKAPRRRKQESFGEKVEAHQRYKLQDGSIVPGSTTILSVIGKGDALVGWANRLGLQGIDSRKYNEEAKAIGTLAHYLVECDARGTEPNLKDYTANQIERASHSFKTWQRFKEGKTLEPVLIEGRLVSEEHRYGGTVDWYGKLDGTPTLIDCKTSSGIYMEHKAQTASYVKLLRENGYTVKRAIVLRLGRNEDDDGGETHELGMKEAGICWQIFQQAHAIYELRKQLKRKG